MNSRRVIALASATLVAGLVIGNLSGAFAARPAANSPTGAEACGDGLRIGPMMRDAGGRLLDVVASATGLTTDEVAQRRTAGESPAQIAEAAGLSADELVESVLDARAEALDEAVASGAVTREQADAALERMRDRVGERVTSPEAGCGAGGLARGERGGGGGRGPGGGACGGGLGGGGACGGGGASANTP